MPIPYGTPSQNIIPSTLSSGDNLVRWGFAESPQCVCGEETQTLQHLLHHCPAGPACSDDDLREANDVALRWVERWRDTLWWWTRWRHFEESPLQSPFTTRGEYGGGILEDSVLATTIKFLTFSCPLGHAGTHYTWPVLHASGTGTRRSLMTVAWLAFDLKCGFCFTLSALQWHNTL